MIKASIIFIAALLMVGCSTTKQTLNIKPSKIIISEIDSELTRECKYPILLPTKKLTQREVEIFWGEDRRSLFDCAERHGMLKEAIEFRDNQIRGMSQEQQKK